MVRAWIVFSLVLVIAGLGTTCRDGGGSSGSSGGGDGVGGACPTAPQPLFALSVTAEDGVLPSDTTVQVRWSAGEEPSFLLADPTTWMSLDQGSNFVCDVEGTAPPADLMTLECVLWTSGATEVEVTATGYLPYVETFAPKLVDHCEEPVPSAIAIELERDLGDERP